MVKDVESLFCCSLRDSWIVLINNGFTSPPLPHHHPGFTVKYQHASIDHCTNKTGPPRAGVFVCIFFLSSTPSPAQSCQTLDGGAAFIRPRLYLTKWFCQMWWRCFSTPHSSNRAVSISSVLLLLKQRAKCLQHIVYSAEEIISCNLPPRYDPHTSRTLQSAAEIASDPRHPGHKLFTTLPFGQNLTKLKLHWKASGTTRAPIHLLVSLCITLMVLSHCSTCSVNKEEIKIKRVFRLDCWVGAHEIIYSSLLLLFEIIFMKYFMFAHIWLTWAMDAGQRRCPWCWLHFSTALWNHSDCTNIWHLNSLVLKKFEIFLSSLNF